MWFWFSFNWKVFWKGLKEQIFLLRVWLPVYPTSGPFIETPPIVFGPVYLPLQGGVLWREVLFLCATSLLISRVCSLNCKDILTLPSWENPYEEFFLPFYCASYQSFIWYDVKKKRKKNLKTYLQGKNSSHTVATLLCLHYLYCASGGSHCNYFKSKNSGFFPCAVSEYSNTTMFLKILIIKIIWKYRFPVFSLKFGFSKSRMGLGISILNNISWWFKFGKYWIISSTLTN